MHIFAHAPNLQTYQTRHLRKTLSAVWNESVAFELADGAQVASRSLEPPCDTFARRFRARTGVCVPLHPPVPSSTPASIHCSTLPCYRSPCEAA